VSLSPRTAAGESPRYYELDPIRFQDLCRDVWQEEPEFDEVEVYGTPGQAQLGIDLLATGKDGKGRAAGQCKCVHPDSFDAKLIEDAVSEFLKYKKHWSTRGVRKFVLFAASSPSRTKIQEKKLTQTARLAKAGFKFELWAATRITWKLRPHPAIVRTYLDEHWVTFICGRGIGGLPRSSSVIDGFLQLQVETLASHVADATQRELESLRRAWREGRRKRVKKGLSRFHEPTRWRSLPSSLQAAVFRLEALMALEVGDLAEAKDIASKAEPLDPEAIKRVYALIARTEGQHETGMNLLKGSHDPENTILYAGFLLEAGRTDEALLELEQAKGFAEYHRLRALAFAQNRDLVQAGLEIQKASEIAGSWNAVVFTSAIVRYFSAVSPAAVPRRIPQWPDPIDWSLVKTDDESRGFLRSAVAALTSLEAQEELSVEDRRIFETWHLACLANDPEQRDAANAYSQEILKRDAGNYRVLAWAIARKLDVSIQPARHALESVIESGTASPAEVIVAVICHIQEQRYAAAQELLVKTESVFAGYGATGLWQFWIAQIGFLSDERPSMVSPSMDLDPPGLPDTQLMLFRLKARQTGDWEPLILELKSRSENGSDEAVNELCMVLGAHRRWKEAEPLAPKLALRIGTAEAVRLAAVILYHAGAFKRCLELLEDRRSVFPHSQLPNEMVRLSISARRELGLLPSAIAGAEDLFRLNPTLIHFLALADLYFEKGDIPSLALFARKHDRFEDLSSTDLLRLAARIAYQDPQLATELWRRARSRGIADLQLNGAMEIGYRLGLDRELRPLLDRLMSLPADSGGYVQRMDLDQARKALLAQKSTMDDVYRMYRAGQISIHVAAQHIKQPLVFWFHRLFLLNEEMTHGAGPVFLRSGSRAGQTLRVQSDQHLSLHADLTALLTAAHFEVLEKIEAAFHPIVLPHDTLVALVAMRDTALKLQPSRHSSLRAVADLVAAASITLFRGGLQDSPFTSSTGSTIGGEPETSQWLVADWSLPLDTLGQELQGLPEEQIRRFRSPHSIVETLRAFGEISNVQCSFALEVLGPERHCLSQRDIPSGAEIRCSAGILEWLAAGGVLEHAARTFHLHLDRGEFDLLVRAELANFAHGNADAAWLSRIIERLTSGLGTETYQLQPAFHHGQDDATVPEALSLEFKCLLDLFQFETRAGDLIWIDDRCVNRFMQREGCGIVDTLDLVYLLRQRELISESDLCQIIHRMRSAEVRFLSLDQREVTHWITHAQVSPNSLTDSRELRTLRRNFARSLLDCDALNVVSPTPGTPVEWPFILASGTATLDAIIQIWSTTDPAAVKQARAEWVLGNLYMPDRGRGFANVEHSAPSDLQLEAAVLAGFLVGSFSVWSSKDNDRRARREFLNWIYGHLIRTRFDTDPTLAKSSIDAAKRMLLQTCTGIRHDQPRAAGALAVFVRTLIEDLPDPLKALIGEDPHFFESLGVTVLPMVQIGPHKVAPERFWDAAVRVMRHKAPVPLGPEYPGLALMIVEEAKQQNLVVEDRSTGGRCVLGDLPVGILSDSVSLREAAIRSIVGHFDLRRAAIDDTVARLSQIQDLGERAAKMTTLKEQSIHFSYLELRRKLEAREFIGPSDLFPSDAGVIAYHLRIDRASGGEIPFKAQLQKSANALLEDVGVEETIARLSALPVELPEPIFERLSAMSCPERKTLLKRLVRTIGQSPVGMAHLARLFGYFGDDSPSYLRYFRTKLKYLGTVFNGPHGAAWREILKSVGDELWYAKGFRELPRSIRLAIIWAHADRLFRIMVQARVPSEWIKDHFNQMVLRLSPEVVGGEEAYTTDVANPDRIEEWPLTLSLIAYASNNGRFVDAATIASLSERSVSEKPNILALFTDLTLAPDSMGSFLQSGDNTNWGSILTPSLVESIASFRSLANLTEAVAHVGSGDENDGWMVLQAVIRDLPIPAGLQETIRTALLNVDLVTLFEKNPALGAIAMAFATQHAPHLGADVVERVRNELLALAEAIARKEPQERKVEDNLQGALVSAAFYLYSRGACKNRYERIAALLEALVARWPSLADHCRRMVDILVVGLPNSESRLLWRLQVKLRAI